MFVFFCIVHVFVNTYVYNVVSFVPKVREKLEQLATERGGIMEKWEDRWEYLQLSVFCFLCYHWFTCFIVLVSRMFRVQTR